MPRGRRSECQSALNYLDRRRAIGSRQGKVSRAPPARIDQRPTPGAAALAAAYGTGASSSRQRLPPQQFQVLLTLFSKFFSSFPHGTCSLSVLGQYLVLGGTYHPLRAAFPNNPTLRKRLVQLPDRCAYGALTLSDGPFQWHLGAGGNRGASLDYNSRASA